MFETLTRLAKASTQASVFLVIASILASFISLLFAFDYSSDAYNMFVKTDSTDILESALAIFKAEGILSIIAYVIASIFLVYILLTIIVLFNWSAKVDALLNRYNEEPKKKSPLGLVFLTVLVLQVIVSTVMASFVPLVTPIIIDLINGVAINNENLIRSVAITILVLIVVAGLVVGAVYLFKSLNKALRTLFELNSMQLRASYKWTVTGILLWVLLAVMPIDMILSVTLSGVPMELEILTRMSSMVILLVSLLVIRKFGKLATSAALANKV